MSELSTINGLMDGISILETHRNEQPYLPEDILYNDKEQAETYLRGLYYDEGYTVSEFRVEDFGESITLMTSVTETLNEIPNDTI